MVKEEENRKRKNGMRSVKKIKRNKWKGTWGKAEVNRKETGNERERKIKGKEKERKIKEKGK